MTRLLTAVATCLALCSAARAGEGEELVGTQSPPLSGLRWVRSAPDELRGRVVLLRWWTGGCGLCVNTAPALIRLHEELGAGGLRVVGIYHPKPPRSTGVAEVQEAARRLGLPFAIASDDRWAVLRRWWLDPVDRSYTSVSFVLDRSGRIRYVHPGGEYFPSDRPEHRRQNADYQEIRSLIVRLLKEKAPPD